MNTSSVLIVAAVSSIACFTACFRTPSDPRAALVGHYRLHVGHGNCAGRGIESSALELRPDGTSEQLDQFKDGSRFMTAGKWHYDGDDHISIDNLRATTTGEIDKNASPGLASLIVQWSKPPNILLNPDDDCLFAKAE
jgi:hypothetical protein